jgi:hypothetical protein
MGDGEAKHHFSSESHPRCRERESYKIDFFYYAHALIATFNNSFKKTVVVKTKGDKRCFFKLWDYENLVRKMSENSAG